jgi:hypothetical protein
MSSSAGSYEAASDAGHAPSNREAESDVTGTVHCGIKGRYEILAPVRLTDELARLIPDAGPSEKALNVSASNEQVNELVTVCGPPLPHKTAADAGNIPRKNVVARMIWRICFFTSLMLIEAQEGSKR